MTQELIPFGKYKGQPAEQLINDPDYAQWLLAQPWFNEKFGGIRTLIVNNFKEAADTPEHNAFQARFLDRQFSFSVSHHVFFAKHSFASWFSKEMAKKTDIDHSHTVEDEIHDGFLEVKFEVDGWDVVIASRSRILWTESVVQIDKPNEDYRQTESVDQKKWDETRRWLGNTKFGSGLDCNFQRPLNKWVSSRGSSWRFVLNIEIKPTLGEDFPSVLRQVKARVPTITSSHREEKEIVLIGSFIAESVSFGDVKEMFATSGIMLYRISDIPVIDLPECFHPPKKD